MPEQIPCVKMTRPDLDDGRSWCVFPLKDFGLAFPIEDEFDGAEVGDRIVIEYCLMTEDEIEALPEFEGW